MNQLLLLWLLPVPLNPIELSGLNSVCCAWRRPFSLLLLLPLLVLLPLLLLHGAAKFKPICATVRSSTGSSQANRKRTNELSPYTNKVKLKISLANLLAGWRCVRRRRRCFH